MRPVEIHSLEEQGREADLIATLRFSVIIPTYQRRGLVLRSLRALAQQEFKGNFEVIVVVDGSTDGTANALRELMTPFPLTVLEQSNQGAATARNQGAAIARGELLLFLDDDMEAHPQLLAEHDRSHWNGADVVLGHIPLHPDSPRNLISAAVERWAENRARRLSLPDASLHLHDLITGQISLSRKTFNRLGGFDVDFTRWGSFGNEDLDFGHRLFREGYKTVFNPKAISWQYYAVGPRQHLRQYRQAGHADVLLVRKHPGQAKEVFFRAGWLTSRYLWRPIVSIPVLANPLLDVLCMLAIKLVERGRNGRLATRLFFAAKTAEYWRGVREAGDIPKPRPLRVLAYHTIADLAGDPVMEPYGIPPDQFRRHLDSLEREGYRFVSAAEALRFFNGCGGLPRRSLLMTFDDCYQELLDVVLPILGKRGITAIAFAVSGRLGGTNDWDRPIGAVQRPLLNADGLRDLAEGGIEIGAHSRTHVKLTRLTNEQLREEIAGSVADLESHGLNRPRFFSYPHGVHNQKVCDVVRESGLCAGFTIAGDLVRPNHDRYQIPRIEILRKDTGWRFLRKVATGGNSIFSLPALCSIVQNIR